MSKKILRRDFLIATALPLLTGRWVFAQSLSHSPPKNSDKLRIAFIGVGGHGASDVEYLAKEQMVAFCDVDDQRAAETYKKYPQVPRFKDYRVLFDKLHKSIDAVCISTPDHSHHAIGKAALELKKHVYMQKPLAQEIYQVRDLHQLAQQQKCVTQMGNQGRSSPGTQKIREWVQSDLLGDIYEIHIHTSRPLWPQGMSRPASSEKIPSSLDWNLWLAGKTPRPYHSAYLPFRWRGWWEFGTGALGDMGCHLMDAAFYALDLKTPKKISAQCTGMTSESFPLKTQVHYEFEVGAQKKKLDLYWHEGGWPAQDPQLREKTGDFQFWKGRKGSLMADECGNVLELNLLSGPTPNLPRRISPGNNAAHFQDWVKGCKDSSHSPVSSFGKVLPLTMSVLAGNRVIKSTVTQK